jgi:hypothetical protein
MTRIGKEEEKKKGRVIKIRKRCRKVEVVR